MIFQLSFGLCAFSVLIFAKPDDTPTKGYVKDDELAFVENVEYEPSGNYFDLFFLCR